MPIVLSIMSGISFVFGAIIIVQHFGLVKTQAALVAVPLAMLGILCGMKVGCIIEDWQIKNNEDENAAATD